MKLVRYLRRSFVQGRLVEPGEELVLPDEFPMAPHMVDVRAESEMLARGVMPPEPVYTHSPTTVYRTDLAYDITAAGGVPMYPSLAAREAQESNLLSKEDDTKPAILPEEAMPMPLPEQPMVVTTPDGVVLRWDMEKKTYVPEQPPSGG